MTSESEYVPEGFVMLPIPKELIQGYSGGSNQMQDDTKKKEPEIKFQRLKPGASKAEQFARNCRVQDQDKIALEEAAAIEKAVQKKYPGAEFVPVSQMKPDEPIRQFTAKGKQKKGTRSRRTMMMTDGDGKDTKEDSSNSQPRYRIGEEEQSFGVNGEEEEGEEDFSRPAGLGLGGLKKKKTATTTTKETKKEDNGDEEDSTIQSNRRIAVKSSVSLRSKRKLDASQLYDEEGEEEDQGYNSSSGKDMVTSSDTKSTDNTTDSSTGARVVFVPAPSSDSKKKKAAATSQEYAEWEPNPDMLAEFRRTTTKNNDMAEQMDQYSFDFREKTVKELREQVERAKAKKQQLAQRQQQQQGPVSMHQSSGNAGQSQASSTMDETS